MTAHRVRHEAGEALGAIGTPECLQLLEHYQGDPCLEVAQTCQLALQRIQYYNRMQKLHPSTPEHLSSPGTATMRDSSAGTPQGIFEGTHNSISAAEESACPYLSVDPAPAAPASTPTQQLSAALLDERAPIFERYRALFALRNKVSVLTSQLAWTQGKCVPVYEDTRSTLHHIAAQSDLGAGTCSKSTAIAQGGAQAIRALDDCMKSCSALLKHEVAYVLGQMQDAAALDCLE